ncbi:MAG TPA: M23 family peptidase, partial [Actinomycetota bacterium]|nr:M23 family peptidase [Actinomycetota bacterium]
MRAPNRTIFLVLLVAAWLLTPWPGSAGAAPVPGSYAWPVRGPVIRPFEAPASPYGPGHRGIDIAATPDTVVGAAEGGVVAFAGVVAGARYVSIDHPDGV